MLSLNTGEAVKYEGDAGITLAGGSSSKLISGAACISTSALCWFAVVNDLPDDLSKLTRGGEGCICARQILHFQGALPKSCCNCNRAILATSMRQTRGR